jgi:Fe-S cluster assembly protein SufD
MSTATTRSTTAASVSTLADLIERGWASGEPIHDLRALAIKRAGELGLPEKTDEEWRYTNPASIRDLACALPETRLFEGGTAIDQLDIDACARVVFVDGRFAPSMSDLDALPEGLSVTAFDRSSDSSVFEELREVATESIERARDGFEALAGGLLTNGVIIRADKGVESDRAVVIVHRSTKGDAPVLDAPRVIVEATGGAHVRVLEDVQGENGAEGLTLGRTDLRAADGARISHSTLQRAPETHRFFSTLGVLQGGRSMVHSDRVLLGSSITRNNIHATITGEHAESAFNGIFLPQHTQHHDSHIRVEHLAPNCHSRQHYRGLLADRARGVFTGRIYVKDVAQKTDAIQHNSNLLLSSRASVTTKPQLEIYADDVRCTHGATSGELDDNSLFYLRSRGVPETTARLLLLHAFAGENIDRIEHADTREAVRSIIDARLADVMERNR